MKSNPPKSTPASTRHERARPDSEHVPLPSTARGQRTRQALLRAARRVFERDGFLDARIKDIADEANVAHGTFYNYFRSKEAIFRQLALDLQDDVMSPYPTESPQTSLSPVERIRTANRRYLESYQQNAGMMAILEQVATFNDAIAELRRERMLAFVARNERAISRLQMQGLAATELDPRYTAWALSVMVSRFAYIWFVYGQDFDFDKAVETLTQMWVNALRLEMPSGANSDAT